MKSWGANYVIKKEVKLLLLAIGLVIVFVNPLEDLYKRIIVNPILSQVQTSIFVDLTLFSFLIWMLIDLRGKYTKRTDIGRGYSAILLFFLGLYSYYRFFSKKYEFAEFYSFAMIKYLDIILLYCLLLLCLYPIQRIFGRMDTKSGKSSELLDEPIEKEEDDVLGRMPKVRLLVDEIVKATNKNSIAYGITGEWGSGKTSFLQLVESEIVKREQKDLLVLHFNPWLNLGTSTIIQEFFEVLQAKIRPYSYDIYMDMNRYSRNIIKSSPSSFLHFVGNLLEFGKKSSAGEDFNNINASLRNLGKKFLIILDDMDRLKAEEVFEILKLIRNTANFDNFIYLVAYDKTYISESLNKIGIPKHNKFAEKIFLKEEHLLPITESRIKKYFADLLKKELPNRTAEIDNYFGYTARELTRDRGDFSLKHIRDVKRFLKNFISDFKKIEHDVDFKDFLNIKLLKFKFYDVYRLLFLDSYYFLDPSENIRSSSGVLRGAMQLAFDEKKGIHPSRIYRKFEDSRLGMHVSERLNLEGESMKELKKLIYSLFVSDNFKTRSHLSIIFSSHFNRYFQDMLDESDISEQVFQQALNKELEGLKKEMHNWKDEGKLEAVRARFIEVTIHQLEDRPAFEKLVKAVFFMASMGREEEGHYLDFFGYDPSRLRDLIGDYEKNVSKKFYNGQREELKNFLLELLHSEAYSTKFCSSFLNWWYSYYHGEDWILSKAEIKAFLIDSFRKYTEKSDVPDGDIWSFYSYCRVTEWDPLDANTRQSRNERFAEAKEIFIPFIETHLDYFLVKFIQTPPYVWLQ